MYVFLTFVVALISLYCLGKAIDAHNTDTTYFMPLATLLVYSFFSLVRELKKDDDYYNDDYRGNSQNTRQYTPSSYGNQNNINQQRINENVEYFAQVKKEKKNNETLLVHYPSNKEVRDKVKELEKKRWFRIKQKIANFFGYDITKKYYEEFKKPYKINKKGKVVPLRTDKDDKENPNRFMPNYNYALEIEKKEYNEVAKLMGRSFEVSLTDGQPQAICEEKNDKQ